MDERRYSETEEKIFAAALEEFSRCGRQGARLQNIADRAGINKALIHYYFRSKDRLYEEVFAYVIRRYFFRMSEAIQQGDTFAVTLRNFIGNYIDLLEDNPALPFFLLRDIADGATVFSDKVREIFLPYAGNAPKAFMASFNAGVQSGEIRPLDPRQTLITVLGSCIYFFAGFPILSVLMPDMKQKRGQFLEDRKQHVFDIIYYGLKPRPEIQE